MEEWEVWGEEEMVQEMVEMEVAVEGLGMG